MYVLKLLKKDHSTVQSLFSKFDRSGKSSHEKRGELFAQIRRELQIHSRAEEEIFYPALKALNDDGRRLVSEALKEHKGIDELLTQISRLKPTNKHFDEKMETLIENVDHHVEEEEGEIFRFAEENCSEEQLEELGRQIEERKKSLDQQMAA
jgi:hemerythrin superfamily protein